MRGQLLDVFFGMMLICGSQAVAAEVTGLGAVDAPGIEAFHKVIDYRCTVCHTREPVDVAIKKRRNLEKIQKRMVERGATLTERDRRVLGTFWGSPLKKNGALESPPSH